MINPKVCPQRNIVVHAVNKALVRRVVGAMLFGLGSMVWGATASAQTAAPEFVPGTRVHVLPFRAPGTVAPAVVPDALNPARTSAKTLKYYGGPVMGNIAVEQVLWGSGTYTPQVAGTVTPDIATFYQGLLTSSFMDMLAQYPSTTQNIGHGTFLGEVTVTPSASANGSTITDASIQSELVAQIKAGALPAPTANSYYAIFFPKGKKITQGGTGSCVSGGFCAYQGTLVYNGLDVTYGVHPDMSAGSGCDVGCGSNSVPFNNLTSVASHELAETATDPAVGLATVYAPPLAWYNATYGEIGDICNAQQGSLVFASGVTYTVQLEWSNKASACTDK